MALRTVYLGPKLLPCQLPLGTPQFGSGTATESCYLPRSFRATGSRSRWKGPNSAREERCSLVYVVSVVAAFVTVVWLREQPRENQGWTSRLEDPYKPLLPMDAEFADIKTKLRRWRSLREEIEEIAKQFADQHDGKTTEEASTYCQPHF